ncbi:hypothetical protein CKAN_01843600 [Cinnamomum micranthum f. kanehirae]|uniref:Uncharacterized protein n=1 Tax=Cinnamomum micranthum f. kanehirae TaxID=337451 RepID=A0A3S3MTB1_9MAGN|nr:hypothetical protein CKAN_01843600 [Cinnamomum micranthum f. kanehirae]
MDLGERRRHFDGRSWTDEKHNSFLNWMEASFVKRMHERDNQQPLLTYAGAVHSHLPLDRYLPDGSDSTVDFQNQGPNINEKKSQANNPHDGARRATNGRRERKRRNGSQDDQVVPQLECMK